MSLFTKETLNRFCHIVCAIFESRQRLLRTNKHFPHNSSIIKTDLFTSQNKSCEETSISVDVTSTTQLNFRMCFLLPCKELEGQHEVYQPSTSIQQLCWLPGNLTVTAGLGETCCFSPRWSQIIRLLCLSGNVKLSVAQRLIQPPDFSTVRLIFEVWFGLTALHSHRAKLLIAHSVGLWPNMCRNDTFSSDWAVIYAPRKFLHLGGGKSWCCLSVCLFYVFRNQHSFSYVLWRGGWGYWVYCNLQVCHQVSLSPTH